MPEDIIPPDDVQLLIDEADERGPYGVRFTSCMAQLVSRDGSKVIKELFWPDAGEYNRRLYQRVVEAANAVEPGSANFHD